MISVKSGGGSGALLYIALLLVALFPLCAVGAFPSKLKLCYVIFAEIDDLGWSYSFNLGRVQSHKVLTAMFPTIEFDSTTYDNAAFFTVANFTANAIKHIQNGCGVLFSNSFEMLGDDALQLVYPNVTFVNLDDERILETGYPNGIWYGFSHRQNFYLKGYAAGLVAQNKICFMSAYEEYIDTNDGTNGFLLGVRAANATIPIEHITTNSWYWPGAEERIASLYLSRGCDIVAHYSDPRFVDVEVAQEAVPGTFSIGTHSDLQLYVGDTVLISSYIDWVKMIVPIVEDVVRLGKPNHTKVPYEYSMATGQITVSELSPRIPQSIRDRFAAHKSMVLSTNYEPFCGTQYYRNGELVQYARGSCKSPWDVTLAQHVKYIQLPFVHFHPDFQYIDSCPAGTWASYSSQVNITLVCTPCAENTYTDVAGKESCTPCAAGMVANGLGNSACVFPPNSKLSSGVIAAIVVPISFILILLVGALVGMSRAAAIKNRRAPRQPPLCLLFTDVESSTRLWNNYPDAMAKAMATHHAVIRQVIEESKAYEVKTVGDSFMIATSNVLDGTMLAIQIQLALLDQKWPAEIAYDETQGTTGDAAVKAPTTSNKVLLDNPWNGLRVRIGVHRCVEVEAKYETLHQYYDYYGNDVNLAARVESQARGGEILMTGETLQALRKDDDYQLLLADDVLVRLVAPAMQLKGISEPVGLFSVTPTQLARREFPPLMAVEGAKAEAASEHDESATQSSVASSHNEDVALLRDLFHPLPSGERRTVMAALCKAHGIDTNLPFVRQLKGLAHFVPKAPRGTGAEDAPTTRGQPQMPSRKNSTMPNGNETPPTESLPHSLN